jgi:hypothetical protein
MRAAGVSAAAGLLPFVPRSIADAGSGPRRLVLVTHGNGTDLTRWRPSGGETDFELSYILEPFAPHRDRLLVLDGLDNEAIADADRRGIGHDGISTLWTGLELPEGEFGDKHVGWPTGPSVDHVIGERIGGATRFPAYYFGTSGSQVGPQGPIRTAHHRGPDQPVQTQNYPARAFDELFAGVAGDAAEAARIRARQESVLDLVGGELTRIRAELPAVDRDRMDAHLDGIRRLEERIAAGGAACITPERPYDFTYEEQDSSENLPWVSDVQLDLLVQTLACDLTRVACFQWGGEGSNGNGSFLDDHGYEAFTEGVHTTSHEMTYNVTELEGRAITAEDRTRGAATWPTSRAGARRRSFARCSIACPPICATTRCSSGAPRCPRAAATRTATCRWSCIRAARSITSARARTCAGATSIRSPPTTATTAITAAFR